MNNENNNSPFQRGAMETSQPEVTLGVSPKPLMNNVDNSVESSNIETSKPASIPSVPIEPLSQPNIANPAPISETPASEPKKKGKGGLIVAIIIILVIAAAVYLIFFMDVFGLKKTPETPTPNDNKPVEVVNDNNGNEDNTPISEVPEPGVMTLTEEEQSKRLGVIEDYLLDFINEQSTDLKVSKISVIDPNCTGYEMETCETSFNVELEKYDITKCDDTYKKSKFIAVESCEEDYVSAKKTIDIKFENGEFSVVK